MEHAAEFRRCLVEMDAPGIRAIWHHVAPNMPQPVDDEEALIGIHLARLDLPGMTRRQRDYSARFLAERETGRRALAVGISVNAPAHRQAQALSIRHEMSEAVLLSVRDGLDLDADAKEVTRRMTIARGRG
jgi:hypothetical protein